MTINLSAELQGDSIVDGEGLRAVIWTQGCSHNCPSCHNPSTHSFTGGFKKDVEQLKREIELLPLIDGVTFSGGDPMFQAQSCAEIAKHVKSLGLNVWTYTGFTFEELLEMSKSNKSIMEFLENTDILIDGKFEIENKSLTLTYRGSKNQRIINVQKSLRHKKVILEKKYMEKQSILRKIMYNNLARS